MRPPFYCLTNLIHGAKIRLKGKIFPVEIQVETGTEYMNILCLYNNNCPKRECWRGPAKCFPDSSLTVWVKPLLK
jgi:hypothetical protein